MAPRWDADAPNLGGTLVPGSATVSELDRLEHVPVMGRWPRAGRLATHFVGQVRNRLANCGPRLLLMEAQVIYLAGGLHSDWRTQVILGCSPGLKFFDPMALIGLSEEEYTAMDIHALTMSDLVFVYMDAANPSGYGLSIELGYAAALGKPIWFVDESDYARRRSFGMHRVLATRRFQTLELAIEALQQEADNV